MRQVVVHSIDQSRLKPLTSAEPPNKTARLNSRESAGAEMGDDINKLTNEAPFSQPKSVMECGSPPKSVKIVRKNCKAQLMSAKAQLPLHTGSPELRNPEIVRQSSDCSFKKDAKLSIFSKLASGIRFRASSFNAALSLTFLSQKEGMVCGQTG
uniref:Uncharacterized protein n=1 Tax=Romanomermis culicivorax TaxID=13658 RepID=A0A915ITK6_ROMCU